MQYFFYNSPIYYFFAYIQRKSEHNSKSITLYYSNVQSSNNRNCARTVLMEVSSHFAAVLGGLIINSLWFLSVSSSLFSNQPRTVVERRFQGRRPVGTPARNERTKRTSKGSFRMPFVCKVITDSEANLAKRELRSLSSLPIPCFVAREKFERNRN